MSELVTFAGPRIGDSAFAASFDRALGEQTVHLVHDLDPVLAQNQPLWNALGFVPTGQLVRCCSPPPSRGCCARARRARGCRSTLRTTQCTWAPASG